jgi:hypothetical protein
LSCIGLVCRPYCDADWPCSEGDCTPIAWGDEASFGTTQYCALGVCDPYDLLRDDDTASPCDEGKHCDARFGDPERGGWCATGTADTAVGETCSYSDDCVPGAGCACLDGIDCADSNKVGTCLAFCEEDWECTGAHPRCVDTGYSVKMCVDLSTDYSECLLTHQGHELRLCSQPRVGLCLGLVPTGVRQSGLRGRSDLPH